MPSGYDAAAWPPPRPGALSDTGLRNVRKEDIAPKVCQTPSGHAKVFETLLGAPQSVLKCLLPLFSTPRGRDVLLYPDKATFYNLERNTLQHTATLDDSHRLMLPLNHHH